MSRGREELNKKKRKSLAPGKPEPGSAFLFGFHVTADPSCQEHRRRIQGVEGQNRQIETTMTASSVYFSFTAVP